MVSHAWVNNLANRMGGLRGLGKTAKNEFQLMRIGRDIANGEDAFLASRRCARLYLNMVLIEVQTPLRDRPQLHGKTEEGKQMLRWYFANGAVHAFQPHRF